MVPPRIKGRAATAALPVTYGHDPILPPQHQLVLPLPLLFPALHHNMHSSLPASTLPQSAGLLCMLHSIVQKACAACLLQSICGL